MPTKALKLSEEIPRALPPPPPDTKTSTALEPRSLTLAPDPTKLTMAAP